MPVCGTTWTRANRLSHILQFLMNTQDGTSSVCAVCSPWRFMASCSSILPILLNGALARRKRRCRLEPARLGNLLEEEFLG